jgi:glutamate-5-semialdehyde dehydrogenase
MSETLDRLEPGMPIPYGGDRISRVPADLAAAFRPGDRLVVVQETGDLLHVPAADAAAADRAVGAAAEAFTRMADVDDATIDAFYAAFADRLDDDAAFAPVAAANEADVADAAARGRSTTRLALTPRMRADMVAGLRGWRDQPPVRDRLVDTVAHDGWRVEQRLAPLGVVAFVFEGRPNVFADATGVLRSGNTVVLRIGSDALRTARAVTEHALDPALADAGLPAGAVSLLDSPSRAAGWAMFADRRIGLAVARGSGPAVAQLGAVARQHGIAVSLHGTGGAWMVAGAGADADRFEQVVGHSLDRKVCNTLNVCCVVADRAAELVPRFLAALDAAAARRGTDARLHVLAGSEAHVPAERFGRTATVVRAEGPVTEPAADLVGPADLGTEWEWEESPEVSLAVVGSVDEAVRLCNRHSPRLVATLVSDDPVEQDRFWRSVDAPFVGDGFTRWVDGLYALGQPELGLSNWEHGRLLGRSGVLSGASTTTIRLRVHQADPDLHR